MNEEKEERDDKVEQEEEYLEKVRKAELAV